MEALTPTKLFCNPDLSLRALFHGERRPVAPPLDREGVTFWLRGGTALWQGLKHTGLKKGDVILFPAYHCGTELDVLRQAGFRCIFYGIDRRLRIDMDEIESLAGPDTRALYVIHYFGFPHPAAELRRFCTNKGWVLIEDCAQALFARSGGQPAGTFGDISIFSLHKFLPIPCAGALIDNHGPHRSSSSGVKRPPYAFVLRQTVDLLGRGPAKSLFMNSAPGLGLREVVSGLLRKISLGKTEKRAMNTEIGPRSFLESWRDSAPPALSLHLIRRLSTEDVFARRRGNFFALLETALTCTRIRPLYKNPENGACPLYFPVTVEGDAEKFIAFCNSCGVMAGGIWRDCHPLFPEKSFPEAGWLRKHVAVLPVHQTLKENQLSLLKQVMKDWDRSGR